MSEKTRVLCPHCGKIFAELDADGCSDKEFANCKDYIGSGDDNDFYFEKGFDIIYEIYKLCRDAEDYEEVDAYIHPLIGIKFSDEPYFLEFLEALPEITVDTHEWCSSPGSSGYYSYVTVNRKAQADLLKNLTVIRDRLKIIVDAG